MQTLTIETREVSLEAVVPNFANILFLAKSSAEKDKDKAMKRKSNEDERDTHKANGKGGWSKKKAVQVSIVWH